MPRTQLEEINYQEIKAHIVDPENSLLNPEQQEILERVVSVAKVLDKNPMQKNAVAVHMAKYPNISRRTAYADVHMAVRLFNTLHNFDYDFWQTWMINDIVKNINRAREEIAKGDGKQTGALLRVIAMEHANMVRAIGEKPPEITDPRLTEKHDYYLYIQINKGSTTREIKIDHNKLKNLPEAALAELNQLLFADREITEDDAEQIMKS